MTRLLARLLVVLTLVGAGLLTPTATDTPPSTAQAADLRFFDAGNIISDGVFFDGLSMDAGAVQGFLEARGASCVAGEMPCLKDYRQDTATQAPDPMCNGYAGAARESAATIIAKVGASCGVSPRVLLVLLQKEQSLVTRTRPTFYAYEKATGFGCPDTAPCNPAFQGFVSQVYFAARQFENYRLNPTRFNYKAGMNNQIYWHPNAACGQSTVLIANQATAGLYNYTPYRPNQAALNAGTGLGDACSSYGNRNFWNYFTDWFGSTQSAGGAAIYAAYQNSGGSNSALGAPTSSFRCGLVGGGCYQLFERGSIYWTPGTGAHVLTDVIGWRWGTLGWEKSSLGYPTTDTWCGLPGGGCFQHFQNGSLYSTNPTFGAWIVRGILREAWAATGWEGGPLGYPTRDEFCGLADGGCFSAFQSGTLYWSPASGAHAVSGAIGDRWATLGWERSSLRYPTNEMWCGLAGGGCFQEFQGGSMYSRNDAGTHLVRGAIRAHWATLGWEAGALGYPTTDEVCGLVAGGCFEHFQHGSIYWSPATGAHAVSGAVRDAWAARGWEAGGAGYPVADMVCGLPGGGCSQRFQGGTIYTATATSPGWLVTGEFETRWTALGGPSGPLGYPTGDRFCGLRSGGCFQNFTGGALYSTAATGPRAVTGEVYTAWAGLGWETGPLGYPVGDTFCGLVNGGCFQLFQYGSLYWSSSTGGHLVRGAIRERWGATGWEGGSLGYPTTDEFCGLRSGGCFQHYERGSIYFTPATGAHSVTGPIRAAWAAQGYEAGSWGYPADEPQAVSGGTTQRFTGGTATLTTSTGTVTFG